jgi:hypothetical protein
LAAQYAGELHKFGPARRRVLARDLAGRKRVHFLIVGFLFDPRPSAFIGG